MDEPDGLRGIATLRAALPRAESGTSAGATGTGGGEGHGATTAVGSAASSNPSTGTGVYRATLSLREQLIDHEQQANWNAALLCYEQALHSLGAEQRWFNAVQEAAGGASGHRMAEEER